MSTAPTRTPAAAGKTGTAPAYHEVHVCTLRVGTVLPFALYTKIEGEYLVYRREHLPFTEMQQGAFLENGIKTLYIAADQVDQLWEYLRGTAEQSVVDGAIPLEERASLFYHTSTELAKRALDLPFSEDNVAPARSVVDTSLRILDNGKPALHALMRQMEVQPNLFQSALNCCQYGLALAQQAGIRDSNELAAFGMGLLFMDLGMLQLPAALQTKEEPYSFDEWSVIKRHPAQGVEMMQGLMEISDLTRAIVIGHHERMDGSGYPQGLHDAELALGLRIAGIVDTFNSLTTKPGTRGRLSTFSALQVMKTEMGGKLDRKLLELFIRLVGIEAA